jgi:hypothetical protein
MNRYYLRHAFSMLLIVMAIAACVLPGQTTPPQVVQPTSGINSNAVATAVAGTAQAAATQTASADLFAPSQTGTAVEQLSDGTTHYTDYDGGFEVIFPTGWLAVRPNSEEFDAALKKQGAVNSMLYDQMIYDQSTYDVDFDRLYAYVLRPDIQKNVILGFSKLLWDSEDTLSLDTVTLGELVRGLESPGGISGFRADTAQLHEDGNVKMIEVGGRFSLDDGQGGTNPFYATMIVFKPSASSSVRITFTFIEDYHTQIAADVKSIIESIKVIEPGQ